MGDVLAVPPELEVLATEGHGASGAMGRRVFADAEQEEVAERGEVGESGVMGCGLGLEVSHQVTDGRGRECRLSLCRGVSRLEAPDHGGEGWLESGVTRMVFPRVCKSSVSHALAAPA